MASQNIIRGPAIFVAQYLSEETPFNSLDGVAKWAADLGYRGIQIPIDERLIDIDRAATDHEYCETLLTTLKQHNVELTELSSHIQGQLVAAHPAYDTLFDGLAPPQFRGDPKARQKWASETVIKAARASKNLGLKAHATFSGALAWPFVYPWPQRPQIIITSAFKELAARWRPILDIFDEVGVDCCFELHPGEDIHDGVSFDRFLQAVDNHRRACILYDPSHFVLQQLDYLAFLDIYHERVKVVHLKDAEFVPDGRQGVYGGYADWTERAGRFRALGDGQIDFRGICTRLAKYGYKGWAVLESECAFKDRMVCAANGAKFITDHIIPVTGSAFDNFAMVPLNEDQAPEVFDAEAKGALEGLRAALNLPNPRRIFVCLDNLGVATCLRGMPADSSQEVFLEFQALATTHGAAEVRWIPGHTNIAGKRAGGRLGEGGHLLARIRRRSPDTRYLRRTARQQSRDAFEAWWDASAPDQYKPLHLKPATGCPPELELPRPLLHHLLAARSRHGDFADYHEKFNHDDARLSCSCGRRKEPSHLFYCRKILPRHRMRLAPSPTVAVNRAIGRDFDKFVKLAKASSFFEWACPRH
ncbi:mutator-like element [Purpureocillium lavendulum]|uniref:Mutator-like element n=1 Tax=Purpureocillium lavendulum TaxID=1247861 RepID=A0AB34FBH1_9HYPO|nr:mutator-like element [Purpureocillium lavendulum]